MKNYASISTDCFCEYKKKSFACEILSTCCKKAKKDWILGKKIHNKVENHSGVPLLSGRRTPKAEESLLLHLLPYVDVWCILTPTHWDSCPEMLWVLGRSPEHAKKSIHRDFFSVTRLLGQGVRMKQIPALVLTGTLSKYWTAHTNTAHKIRERVTTAWPDKVLSLHDCHPRCANKISVK